MRSKSWKRRRLLASQAKQQRLHRWQRMWMMEHLEVRASPGSMIVDVAVLAGQPVAGVGHTTQPLAVAESNQATSTPTANAAATRKDRVSSNGEQAAPDGDSQPRARDLQRARADSERSIHSRPEPSAPARDTSIRNHSTPDVERSRAALTKKTDEFSTGLDDALAELLGFEFTTDTNSLNESQTCASAAGGLSSASSQSPDPALDPHRESPWASLLTSDRSGFHSPLSSTSDRGSSAGLSDLGSFSSLSSSRSEVAGNLPQTLDTISSTGSSSNTGSSNNTSSVLAAAVSETQPSATLTPRETGSLRLGFSDGLTGWTQREMGGSETGRGTVTAGSAILREGDSFLVAIERDFLLTDNALSLSFTYEASFDTTDPNLIKDAFEAALLDSDGFSLADTFRTDRDSYYNVTEGLPPAMGAGTTVEEIDYLAAENGRANRVTLDLGDVPDGSQSLLVFRLVNNDSDTQTYARIFDVELTYAQSSSISGIVYADLNNDGVKDVDEVGLPGVTVSLSGPVERTILTGADGTYQFAGLADGVYSVSETQPAGYLDGIDTPGQPLLGSVENDRFFDLSLSDNVALVNYNFGERPNNAIAGFVYVDVNNDGVKDAGEAGLPGVTIMLRGPVERTVLTGVDGSYGFDALPDGVYTVSQTQPAGYLNGIDTPGQPLLGTVENDLFVDLILAGNISLVNYNFGERPNNSNSVAGFVYVDINNDGVKDPDEIGLAGVTITLSGPIEQTVITGHDGSYLFEALPDGLYSVNETQPAGYLDGIDTSGQPLLGSVENDRFFDLNLSTNLQLDARLPSLEFVTVGNPGNAADDTGYGAVDYVYAIGKYEVTADQWAAVRAADPSVGNAGSWSGSQPTAGTTWYEAARFCNWLTTGSANSGAYNTSTWAVMDRLSAVTTFGTAYFIPTENEWYKAAYYDPNLGGTGIAGYWDYPTKHDSAPDGIDHNGDAAFDAVFFQGYNQGQPNSVYNAGVLSAYGTMAQGGNVIEWSTDTTAGSQPVMRGGSWGGFDDTLLSSTRTVNWNGSYEIYPVVGFRVASVSNSSSVLVNYNFAERPNNSVAGFVYLDVDNDGVKDADELGLPGVTITLSGPVDQVIVTGADGSYRFDELPDGVYSVSETQPADYLDGIDTPGQPLLGGVDNDRFFELNLSNNFPLVNYNFGERTIVVSSNSISGFVYVDVNNNGVKDAVELVLPNVPISLNGPISRTIVTAADGSYRFDDLPAGTYTVTEIQPLAFMDGRDTQGTPTLGSVANDQFYSIDLTDDIHATGYNFGEWGLKAELISKQFYLASTPDGQQLMSSILAGQGTNWFKFAADVEGTFRASVGSSFVGGKLELYTAAFAPVAITHGQNALVAQVVQGESYVLHVANETLSDAIRASLSITPNRLAPGNPPYAVDVNNDGWVSPIDVLLVINYLNHPSNSNGELNETTRPLDVDRNSYISPRDALIVINYLNHAGDGEGESSAHELVGLPLVDASHELGESNSLALASADVGEGEGDPPSNVDLTIGNLDTSGLVYDGQNLTVSGTISAMTTNRWTGQVNEPFDVVFFEDLDGDEAYNAAVDRTLGSAAINDPLIPGESRTVSTAISSSVQFAENVIWAMVDAHNVIAENNEANNLARTTSALPPVDVGALNPVVKWNKTVFTVLPKKINVASSPVVIDLYGNGSAAIVFSSYETAYKHKNATLRAINGSSGSEIWSVTDTRYELDSFATIAAGDIDGDGRPEIVGIHESGGTIAFEHDGRFKWLYSSVIWSDANGGPAIADLDGDGMAEVIVGNVVINGIDGTPRWNGANVGGTGEGLNNNWGPVSIVADIDLDGRPEVIAGNSAYRYDGTLYWNKVIPNDGFAGVGNFDDDPYAEVVLVSKGNMYLLEHDGKVKWGPKPIPGGGRGGPPTIADMTGDGKLEIGIAGAASYSVFRSDGSTLWSKSVQDASSNMTGSSVFDFNGDGIAEVVYGDEFYLRIYRGLDGEVLYQLPKSSATSVELPVIADVNRDGHAEIVAVANLTDGHGTQAGIFVIGGADNNWVGTRKIWNQHSYHITNVNDDGTIPAYEEPSWLVSNTYRLNAQPGLDPLAAPDLTASYLRAVGTPQQATLTARVGNGGMLAVPAGVYVAFYDADPDAGGMLLGRTLTTVALNPGEYQDVSIFARLASQQDVWVIADDDGTGVGQIRESDEDNNTHHALLQIPGPEIVVTTPADGVEITAGETVVIGGSAFIRRSDSGGNANSVSNRIVAVLINNSAVEVLDAGGNFFTQVDVLPGENVFDLTAFDANGQTAATRVTIVGSQAAGGNVDLLFDVSPSFAPLYARTSFEQRSDRLFAELAIHNVGQYPADNPFYVGVRHISDPTVTVRDAAGMTADGTPYYNFSEVMPSNSLAPEQITGFVHAVFHNPSRLPFTYELVFLAKLNEAPKYTSVPIVETYAGRDYRYDAEATDPDNDPLTYTLVSGPTAMTIDTATGRVSWLPAAADLGVHPVILRVEDGRGGSAEHRYLLSVTETPSNRPPYFVGAPLTETTVSSDGAITYRYDAEARDPDLDALQLSIVTGPDGMDINPDTGVLSWAPTAMQLGDHSVTIEATDGRGGLGQQSYVLSVRPQAGNHPPAIVSEPMTSVVVPPGGTGAYAYAVAAIDADHDPLTFAIIGTPPGMDVDPNTGLISWPITTAHLGVHTVTVQVSDGRGGFGEQSYTLNVLAGGTSEIRGLNFNDLNGDGSRNPNEEPGLADWTIYLDENRNSRPDLGERFLVTDADGNFAFTDLPAGDYVVVEQAKAGWKLTTPDAKRYMLSLSDAQIVTGIDFGNSRIIGFNLPPEFTSDPPQAAVVDQLLRYGAVAIDPDNDALTFDLPLAPAGMTVHPARGVVMWQPTREQVGTHQAVLRVQDGQGGIALQSFSVTVAQPNTAPVITSTPPSTAVVEMPLQHQVRAQDADGDELTFRLENAPDRATINAQTGVLTWTATAAQLGDHTFTVVVSDGRGGEASQQVAMAVVATAPNDPPTITSEPRLRARVGQPFGYFIEAHDPNGDPLSYYLDTAPVGMTLDELHVVRWQPPSALLGTSQSVSIRVEDGRGGIATQTFDLEVVSQDTNQAPWITSTPPLTGIVGRAYRYQLTARDPEGDPVVWSLDSAPSGMSIDPARGTLRWIPAADQIGTKQVVVRVQDIHFATSTQSFAINVRAVNLPPSIRSTPPVLANQDELYVYAVRAVDPDGDPLAFSLAVKPEGMTIEEKTGLVRWTPSAAAVGQHTVRIVVADGQGAVDSQTFTLHVGQQSFNRPPLITSTPKFSVTGEEPYEYQVTATDPEGDEVTFELAQSPVGMTIDGAGLVQWLPPLVSEPVEHLITVVARDPSGARSVQTYLLIVSPNQPPQIHSTALDTVVAGATYAYDVRATDPDGHSLTYTLISSPAGMRIDGFGRVRWSTTTAEIPTSPHDVQLAVSDAFGGVATESFTITVIADTEAPRVTLSPSTMLVNLNTEVTFVVRATDNVGVETLSLLVGGADVPLIYQNGIGYGTLRMTGIGEFSAVATATDAAGNVGQSDTLELTVRDPSDVRYPRVAINALVQGSRRIEGNDLLDVPTLTYLTDIVATVEDNDLSSWWVEYARADLVNLDYVAGYDSDFVELASGSDQVIASALATFDATLLPNDSYVIRVSGMDVGGRISSEAVVVAVSGEAKLGNFRLELTDLQVPLSGIPITVGRVYDTLNASEQGDFGYGWSLAVQDAKIRESVRSNAEFEPGKTRVYLTTPDGRRVGFTYQEEQVPIWWLPGIGYIWSGFFGDKKYRMSFKPDPGVKEKLTIDQEYMYRGGLSGTFFQLGSLIGGGAPVVNPDKYTLTTSDGLKYRYDQFEGLQYITDANNNRVTFTDTAITHSAGGQIQLIRDGRGRIKEIVDTAGNSIYYQYDAVRDLASVTNQIGETTTYAYLGNPAHFLDEIYDSSGVRIFKADFDDDGRLIRATDAVGNVVQQQFDPGAFTATTTDARGYVTTLWYDELGNVTQEESASVVNTITGETAHYVKTYEYNDPRHPDKETKVVEYDGTIVEHTYDTAGNATKTTRTSADGSQAVSTSYTYDARNNLTRLIAPNGSVSTFGYSGNNATSVTSALGDVAYATYTSGGKQQTFTDFNGNITQYDYKDGCPCGTPKKVTHPDGSYEIREWNRQALVTRVEYYEADGTLTYVTATDYDNLGRKTRETVGAGTDAVVTTYAYYGSTENITRQTVVHPTDASQNRVTQYFYNAAGQLVRQVDPDLDASDPTAGIFFKYDASGNRVWLRDPVGNVTTWIFDAINRVIEERDPLYWDGTDWASMTDSQILALISTPTPPQTAPFQPSHITRYAYDGAGQLTEQIDRNGRRRTFEYDYRGNMLEEVWYDAADDVTVMRELAFTCDTSGNMLTAVDPDAEYFFAYDTMNRLTTMAVDYLWSTGFDTFTLIYQHDAMGNIVATTDSTGVALKSTYDNRYRLESRWWEGDSVDNIRVDFDYAATGQLAHTDRWVDKKRTTSAGSTDYAYDLAGRVQEIMHKNALDEVLAGYEYTHDFSGLLTQEVLDHINDAYDRTADYGYDLRGQLIAALYDNDQEDEWFAYDANGNRTGSYLHGNGYSTGPGNQLLSDGTFDYTYDHEGNTVTKTRVTSVDGEVNYTEYQYDFRNRITRVTQYSKARIEGGILLHEESYRYDALGRRIEVVTDDDATISVYDDQSFAANEWARFNAAVEVIQRFLFTNNVDQLVAQWVQSQDVTWALTDHLGTIRDSVSNAGPIVQNIQMTAFGQPTFAVPVGITHPYAFTGRVFDGILGSSFHRARFYDVEGGRFVSTDPIGFDGGDPNTYRFVLNNSVNLKDPFGLTPIIDYSGTTKPSQTAHQAIACAGRSTAASGIAWIAVEIAWLYATPLSPVSARETWEALQTLYKLLKLYPGDPCVRMPDIRRFPQTPGRSGGFRPNPSYPSKGFPPRPWVPGRGGHW